MTGHPRLAHAYDVLAAIARQIADDRAAGDPRFVEQGRLTEQQAIERLRVARALAAEWRALADLEPMPEPTAGRAEILALLEHAGEAWRNRAARARQAMVEAERILGDFNLYHLYSMVETNDRHASAIEPFLVADTAAEALAAMLWWHHRAGVESIRFLRSVTAELRAKQVRG